MTNTPLVDIGVVEKLDPNNPSHRARMLWSMVLLLAVKDMATVVRFEPFRGKRSLMYRVNGLYHDLMSPPREMADELIGTIDTLIRQGRLQRRRPLLSRLLNSRRKDEVEAVPKALVELKVRNELVDAIFTMPPTKYGRSVVIYLVDSSTIGGAQSTAATEAAELFRRMFGARDRDPTGHDLPF
jgi:type II secretory ATPase GspE/PulE/Tfp pilus assembly ATPase PilB-like protein